MELDIRDTKGWHSLEFVRDLENRISTLTEENRKLKADYETINKFSIDQADLAVEQQTQINKLKEALKKAERLLIATATEVQRKEIQNFLSGNFKEQIEAAVFNDSFGMHSLLQTDNKTE